MTLTTTTPKVTANTDGSNLAFDFTFKMWDNTVATELAVIFNEGETDEATLVVNTDYTLSAPNNNYSTGGTVTLATGSDYAANGNTITIKSDITRSQTYDLLYGGEIDPESLEEVLDRMVRIIQEAELNGTIEQTALSSYMKTFLTDTTAQEARDTLLIAPTILCHEGEILVYENEILTYS